MYQKELGGIHLFYWDLEFWEGEVAAELLFSVAHSWLCTKRLACELQKDAAAAAIWRVNSPVR